MAWGIPFVLLLAVSLPGQISRLAKGRDVKFPEFYESQKGDPIQTNRLRGLLMASQGQYLSNDMFLLTQMRLEHYRVDGETNLIAQAPECLFNADSRVASSTGRLEIVGMNGAFVVQGQRGFEVRMTNSTMSLSNRVRTMIRLDLLSSSREARAGR